MGARHFFVLGLLLVSVLSEDPCHLSKNCKECMSKGPSCSWCYDNDFDDTRVGPGFRCASNETLIERGCPLEKITTTFSTLAAAHFEESSQGTELQLKPHKSRVQLRPGAKLVSDFVFESIKDYPVDLYFLVDLSYTMRDDLDTVSNLTNDIVREMKSVTKDLQMGFGAFVDKPVYPFVMPSQAELENPCLNVHDSNNMKCDPTFLYKHILDITGDYENFQKATKNIRPSGNLDSPEGGLDALLQVAYCQERINWRKNARKIVVFASDGGFHLAGDGKLAGLIKPPPTSCQLTKRKDPGNPNEEYWGWYTANETDYPSVGEVTHVLTEHAISVIFATTNQFEPLYTKLAEFLPNAGVGILEEKSTNIVKLLRENYEKIANKAELLVTPDSELSITVLTKCENESEFTEKSTCPDHPVGGRIEYRVEVLTNTCFEGTKEIKMKLLGFDDESVITVESACDCKVCTESLWPTKSDPFSMRCNNHGHLNCGTCQCSESFSGEFCECQNDNLSQESDKACLVEGETEVCSGRGRCTCGKCKCNQDRYYEKFCQCDLLGCKRASDDNLVCGGSKRGTCGCNGKCECKEGFTGEACDCLTSEKSCYHDSPLNPSKTKCSGNGICDCGSCFCKQGYTGQYCEEIQGGKSALCNDLSMTSCVTCLHDEAMNYDFDEDTNFEKLNEDLQTSKGLDTLDRSSSIPSIYAKCQAKCNSTKINPQKIQLTNEMTQNDGYSLCIIYTKDNCRLFFNYRYSDVNYPERKVNLKLVRKKECTNTTEILYIILGVILAIVLGGLLLLLIYKLVITIDDKKSYASVLKELENTRWEMTVNPTYTQPSTTVLNPTFQSD